MVVQEIGPKPSPETSGVARQEFHWPACCADRLQSSCGINRYADSMRKDGVDHQVEQR